MSTRISFKRCDSLASSLGLRLVKHQYLGNRANYYYLYSVVRDAGRIEHVIGPDTMKNVYNTLMDMVYDEIEQLRKEKENEVHGN